MNSTAPTMPTQQDGPEKLLLTAREAATLLSISERKLWELTNTRTIHCVRIGRSVRYPLEDLRAWVNHQRR